MNLIKHIFTNSSCYKSGKTITPKGVVVHSTGANNPKLSRYVDGSEHDGIGVNKYGNHWNRDENKCVHAFIGKMEDGTIASVQTLPWNHRGWHAGTGSKGSANNTHISFEICEDGLADSSYFSKVYTEAVELVAMICTEFNLNPMDSGVIICHSEAHLLGVASNHADVMHWFPKFGKSMDTFRKDVFNMVNEKKAPEPASPYASEAWELCFKKGIMDGTRPGEPLTRQQLAVILNRLGLVK